MAKPSNLIPIERIQNAILLLRGHKVMLDAELAALYGVTTGNLNKAVKRNKDRFPLDCMFRPTITEADTLIFQFGRSKGRGGTRHCPLAFTEQGVAMRSKEDTVPYRAKRRKSK
jgi:hypothetical protein